MMTRGSSTLDFLVNATSIHSGARDRVRPGRIPCGRSGVAPAESRDGTASRTVAGSPERLLRHHSSHRRLHV